MKNTNTLNSKEIMTIQLQKLKQEHRDLDNKLLDKLNPILDPLVLRRLKKRKLLLKDKIKEIQNKLTPNIIA